MDLNLYASNSRITMILGATSYEEAIEINIKASGDSCGRPLILGVIMAAYASQHQNQKANVHYNGLLN